MKKYLNLAAYAFMLLAALSFTSCQEEFEEVNTSTSEGESFKASSGTAKLLENTASMDGSFDNIVDGSSCFALNFPYTINVNGLDLTIDTREDLDLIEEIFDEFDDDIDELDIFFPVTVTLSDYSVIQIDDADALAELARECVEGGDDDDIECIDFVYPITLFTFDLNNTQTGQASIDSDEQLRRFFKDLDDDAIVSIEFPVTLVKFDGTEIRVTNNAELAAALEMARDICDEDDDDDYNDDDFDEERLEAYLTECPWNVLTVERNGVDQSPQYDMYRMFFSIDGTVQVKDRDGNTLIGEWDVDGDDEYVELDLEFDTLVDFDLEWLVYEIEPGKIKLFAEGGNRIVMRRDCEGDGSGMPPALAEVLRECDWVIKKVKNQGEEIDRLVGYKLEFMAEGMIALSNSAETFQGTWEVTGNESGQKIMVVSIGDEPAITFEWMLRDMLQNRLRFEGDFEYEMILEKVCAGTTDGDVSEISNVLMGGDWVVASYVDEGEDKTTEYAGYDFTFGSGNVLTVSTNMDPLKEGLWRVIRDHDGMLKVYLNLGDDGDTFSDLTDDWDFVSITENRIELKDISGDGTVTTLVFEK